MDTVDGMCIALLLEYGMLSTGVLPPPLSPTHPYPIWITTLTVLRPYPYAAVLQLLLSYGANPGVYNHAGCIAVDIAREFGQADVAVRPPAPLPHRLENDTWTDPMFRTHEKS